MLENERDQWSKINEIKDSLHKHEIECAERWGRTDQRLDNIEKMLKGIMSAVLTLIAAAMSGIVVLVVT